MTAPVVLLDTDVASAMYKKKPFPILNAIIGFEPCISFVTFAEMAKWAEVRSWASHNRAELGQWLGRLATIHSNESICTIWAALSADGHMRGRHRPHNDTWVAAVALAYRLPLATLNSHDYEDVAARYGLQLVRA